MGAYECGTSGPGSQSAQKSTAGEEKGLGGSNPPRQSQCFDAGVALFSSKRSSEQKNWKGTKPGAKEGRAATEARAGQSIGASAIAMTLATHGRTTQPPPSKAWLGMDGCHPWAGLVATAENKNREDWA
eukprot:GGOE01033225.1.p6 GENE.GGOE01033225.1~~GGOE01033225.1.p6  ORF type:complete len:129 (+),score=9.41 GGOE01033225.1:1215-1601(+)